QSLERFEAEISPSNQALSVEALGYWTGGTFELTFAARFEANAVRGQQAPDDFQSLAELDPPPTLSPSCEVENAAKLRHVLKNSIHHSADKLAIYRATGEGALDPDVEIAASPVSRFEHLLNCRKCD